MRPGLISAGLQQTSHLSIARPMARPNGWRDDELYALLQLLRARMTEYIYATDEAFAQAIQREFSGKPVHSIMEAVRDLMDGLAFAMKTRKFSNEVLVVDGTCVYPHDFLYKTMAQQPENRQGGVWDPDDLRKTLRKMEIYRHLFDENPELFFARAQIWSKNVPDIRTKFYLWRELYVEEAREGSGSTRSVALRKIFENVPPPPSPVPPTPSPASPSVTTFKNTPVTAVTAATGRPPKVRMWTPEDLELFVQLLVDITLDLQTKGTSPLVHDMAERLNRSAPSLLSKVQDIRARFEKQTMYHRAAEIPRVIYDPISVAHKIFTANWSDRDEPYSFAIFALKDLQNRTQNMKRQAMRPPRLQMEMRPRTSTLSPSAETPTPTTASHRAKPQIQPIAKNESMTHGKPPRVPTRASTPTYSEFVRDCATMINADEASTHKLCTTIQKALRVYATTSRKAFYEDIAVAMGDGVKVSVVYFRGERILRLCERRYGSLDCFVAAVEGTPAVAQDASELLSPQRADADPCKTPLDEQASPTADKVVSSEPLQASTKASEDALSTKMTRADAPRAVGKSSEKAKRILQQKGDKKSAIGTLADRTESSPSVHHESSDRDELDGDGDRDEDEVDGNDDDNDDAFENGDDGGDAEDDDDQTQSLGSSDVASDVSSDYGHDGHAVVRSHRCYHHHDTSTGRVHVSARKTLVVKHAPTPCHCEDNVRPRPISHDAIHRKRSRSELYAENGRWIEDHHAVHEIAHRHVRYDVEPNDVMVQHDMIELDTMWAGIMVPIEDDIKELEAKRQEQRERAADRERKARDKHWKKELRQQVRAEWTSQSKPSTAWNVEM